MKFSPNRCELADRYIIDGVRANLEHSSSLAFIKGDPGAVLMIEFNGTEHQQTCSELTERLKTSQLGGEFTVLTGKAAAKAWAARKAGLGGLSNINGSKSAIALIEDAAVDISDLPNFVADVDAMLESQFSTDCVKYGPVSYTHLTLPTTPYV